MALIDKLTNIADAIRTKTGKTALLTLDAMPTEIQSISGGGGGGIPSEFLTISGFCTYRFAYNGWNWFINEYGNQITTSNVDRMGYMFYESDKLEYIPFEINCVQASQDIGSVFAGCKSLKEVPKINNICPKNMGKLFNQCYQLRYLPEDFASWFDWKEHDNATGGYACEKSYLFANCNSLRSVPMEVLAHSNPYSTYSYSYFNNGFTYCYALDELVELPVPYIKSSWTSNAFSSMLQNCSRLQRVTFALNNGQPYVVSWKSQSIDLSSYLGYASNTGNIINNNSGITADKEVTDDATYQALKNDPDWFTCNAAYCRYNHDSAVETINSLPDTSAYLATAGGTNTIKFRGAAGNLTDGGAVNTLTEEEIAVAAAKGWTVSIV